MRFEIVIRTAVLALRRSLLRTCLTALGLVIGVAAVITIVSLGQGARAAIEDEVDDAGTNLIIVTAGNWTAGGVRLGMGSSSTLTAEDAEAFRSVPGVAYVSPSVRTRQQIIAGSENWSANVEGVGADLPKIRSWPLLAGSFFGPGDVAAVQKVCVIGTIVRDVLFGSDVNPVGRQVRIGLHPFTIVGVLASKGQSSGGEDQDDAVFVPYTTAQKRLMGVTYLRNVSISAVSAERVSLVARDVSQLLRLRHAILPGDPDDFRVRTLEEMIAVRTRTTRTMTSLLSGIAAVSLLVGGIGVMNIMLVSVTERTREIGIRVAVGARQRDVRLQFLTEAVILSLTGGLLGIGLGYLLSQGVTQFLGWPTLTSTNSSIVAFAFSAGIGIFFGWYPATKAAATEPIDALRFE
ncbi:MAG TPA: ABC transporter permease [Vicinamibacterales bacterium]|nr:ABC transporter permease [Vicinamibacterales bacterium]